LVMTQVASLETQFSTTVDVMNSTGEETGCLADFANGTKKT
jgi:hypothetical protein